jgi:hypothetical protein
MTLPEPRGGERGWEKPSYNTVYTSLRTVPVCTYSGVQKTEEQHSLRPILASRTRTTVPGIWDGQSEPFKVRLAGKCGILGFRVWPACTRCQGKFVLHRGNPDFWIVQHELFCVEIVLGATGQKIGQIKTQNDTEYLFIHWILSMFGMLYSHSTDARLWEPWSVYG